MSTKKRFVLDTNVILHDYKCIYNFEENDIYKTLALTGDKTGPVIGIVPITEHLSEKKLAKISGNKKVSMTCGLHVTIEINIINT